MQVDPIESASVAELPTLPLERLRWSLSQAYESVTHYGKKFDDAGAHPSDLKALSDLAKFPFTTKADLRDTFPFGMFSVPRERIVRVHASSGTTGKPTVVGYTAKDIDTSANLAARTMRRMQKITGRSDNMMIIRGVNMFPSQIEELILQRPLQAPHDVCEIHKDGPLDRLTVRVELKASEHTDGSAAAGARAALEHTIKSLIGVSCRVEVEPANAIERSVGKARRVVDRRPR